MKQLEVTIALTDYSPASTEADQYFEAQQRCFWRIPTTLPIEIVQRQMEVMFQKLNIKVDDHGK